MVVPMTKTAADMEATMTTVQKQPDQETFFPLQVKSQHQEI
jgi:hypothetical protein